MQDNKTSNPLAESMDEIHKRIIEEHRDQPHPSVQTGALKAHLLIHGIVEKQILEKNPPQVLHALERMLNSGMSRHEAIHSIGQLVTTEAMSMMKENREMDLDAYIRALDEL